MKIVDVNVDELKEAEYNPRKINENDFNNLKQSIKDFGIVQPILVNSNPERLNIVIGGHQRLKAIKAMKIKKVPCIFIDLELSKERELNVRLNKNKGEFDLKKLNEFFDSEDLKYFGFEDFEIEIIEGSFSEMEFGKEVKEHINKEKGLELVFGRYKMDLTPDQVDSFFKGKNGSEKDFLTEIKSKLA